MWILPLVGYMGLGLGFSFLTLAIACGLYYLSEVVEEHTVISKKILTRMIYTVIAIQVLLLLVDGFPFKHSLLSIVSHLVYLGNMRRFPIVKLSEPLFLISCVLVLLNHWVWFTHFSSANIPPPRSMYEPSKIPSFTEIASFFGICVWLVPFSLFVSLSASDNVLPTMGSEEPGGQKNKRQGMFKAIVDRIGDFLKETGRLAGWGQKERGF